MIKSLSGYCCGKVDYKERLTSNLSSYVYLEVTFNYLIPNLIVMDILKLS
jgi:hypothetical protein